jgi:hypothetical protein
MLVIAKAPVPGLVKTRMCPPCTPAQAAAIADAALRDTLAAVGRGHSPARSLVLRGSYTAPPGWSVITQRGIGLAERLANAFADAPRSADGQLLIGMDTPQVTPELLAHLGAALDGADVVIAPALDGGWWALGLRDPRDAGALLGVPMSTAQTGRLTVEAFRERGRRVVLGPWLRDVDTADDARHVAQEAPHGRFAAAVRDHVPVEAVTR